MAVNWLKGDRDFNQGMNILMQTGFKPGVVGKLFRIGQNAPAAMERLTFLIREFISVFGLTNDIDDTDAELHVFSGEEAAADTPDKTSRAILAVDERKDAPERIGKVIHEYAALYKQRDIAFNALKKVGEGNDENTKAKRKELSDTIDKATTRMELLYPLYEKYLEKQTDISETEYESVTTTTVTKKKEENSDKAIDLKTMSKSQLKRERKRLEVKRTRTKNMLLYQQYTRQPEENPMPESPARVKYTNLLNRIQKEIEEIDYAIAEKFA